MAYTSKTFSLKEKEIEKKWLIVDAQDLVLGRLASQVAMVLMGKNKPTYTPHMDCGDNVVIINAEKVHLTGNKRARKDGKIYYRHTGHPGGIKTTTAGRILEGKRPEDVVKLAVQRMLTRNTMGRKRMTHLFIYAGDNHPHSAQKPEVFDIANKNSKNSKRDN